jgi:hypothetical protein
MIEWWYKFLAWTVGLAKSFLMASNKISFHSLATDTCVYALGAAMLIII